MKKIIILGSGGMARNAIDLINNEQRDFKLEGIIDPKRKKPLLGVPVLGDDSSLAKIIKKYSVEYVFPAIGFGENIDNTLRYNVYKKLLKFKKVKIPNLISSKALIRSNVKMGQGNIIQAGSIVDTSVTIKNNVNIGLNVMIGHSSIISDHVTIAGSVNINGSVKIGQGSFIGMGAVIYKNIGNWSKVSPNATCLKEVGSYKIVYPPTTREVSIKKIKF